MTTQKADKDKEKRDRAILVAKHVYMAMIRCLINNGVNGRTQRFYAYSEIARLLTRAQMDNIDRSGISELRAINAQAQQNSSDHEW